MTLDNVLGRSREEVDGHWVFRYENGLVVHTDPFLRADGDRILPVGGPQDTMCNYLARAPERVRDKRVLDAFAGSGVLGLMALKLGAARVDFVDVNPRARRFQEANAERNGFDTTRYEAHLESIETFESSPPYDLVLANPPFVPTPPGIDGTLTSAAGAEGNDLVGVLLRRLEGLLLPTGEAFVYLMQLVAQGTPLIAPSIAVHITDRPVDLTPTQEEPFPLDSFCTAYRQCFVKSLYRVVRLPKFNERLRSPDECIHMIGLDCKRIFVAQ